MNSKKTQERLLQVKSVASIVGLGVSTIWAKSRAGSFPKPIKISQNVTRWRLSDIDAWLENPAEWEAK